MNLLAPKATVLPERIPAPLWPWFWLLLAALLYTPFINTEIGQGNVASDLAAIESLVQRHTFFINDSTFDTIDKFKRGDRFFSQKSPVFHLLAAAPGWAAARLGWTLSGRTDACLRLLTFVMVILPMGWLLGLIFRHPWVAALPPRARVLFTLAFALGSLLTPFAVTLNHYVLAAACLMAAVNVLTARGLATPRAALAAGFWVSASLAADVPPAFLFGLGLAAWALVRAPRRLLWLALGAAPLLLLYAALNQHILGSPLPPNLHDSQYQFYEGSFWAAERAKAAAGHPGYYEASYARRLVHATVGHKGIYWMMPLLALATAAALWLARRRAAGWPLALAWAAFPPLAIALTMRWAWDLSGGAYNIRHILAAVPPLYCVLAHPALPRPGRLGRGALQLAAAWGCLVAALGVMNPWSHNTLSAWPPLENLARWSLGHALVLPTGWIGPLIRATSVTPEVGWLDLGQAYIGQAQAVEEPLRPPLLDSARRALSEAVRLAPRESLPYYYLGMAQDMAGRPGEAVRSYQALLAFDPGNVGAWNTLGKIALLHLKDPALARDAFRRSLALTPDNPSAIWGELYLGAQDGRPDLPRLRDALRRYPDEEQFKDLAARWGLTP